MMLRVLMLLGALSLVVLPDAPVLADGCYTCSSGSSCGRQCRYSGGDSSANREACRRAGCRISGTASCSTASNVRVCAAIPKYGTVGGRCYICRSGSACGSYCAYRGGDTSENRRACQRAGCRIGGTASCPRASNVRVCVAIPR